MLQEDWRGGVIESGIITLVYEIGLVSDVPGIGKGDRDISRPIVYFVFVTGSVPNKLKFNPAFCK